MYEIIVVAKIKVNPDPENYPECARGDMNKMMQVDIDNAHHDPFMHIDMAIDQGSFSVKGKLLEQEESK